MTARYHPGRRSTAAQLRAPAELEAARARPRRGASPATRCGCSSPTATTGRLDAHDFSELPRFLDEGDLVVVNTSGTLAAELDGIDPDGQPARGPPLDRAAGGAVDARAAP